MFSDSVSKRIDGHHVSVILGSAWHIVLSFIHDNFNKPWCSLRFYRYIYIN